jgi:dipeptidyl aminopeptidase/acylaminoacyl peptidase
MKSLLLSAQIFIIMFAQGQTFIEGSSSNIFSKNANQFHIDSFNIDYHFLWSQVNPKPEKDSKTILDFSAINSWIDIRDRFEDVSISNNGNFFSYVLQNQPYHRHSLIVQSIGRNWKREIPDGSTGFFAEDSKQYIFKLDEDLCFLSLGIEQLRNVKHVVSYQTQFGGINKNGSTWIAYLLKNDNAELVLENLITRKQEQFRNVSSYSFDQTGCWLILQGNTPTKELIVYNLNSGTTLRYNGVIGYLFDNLGKTVVIKTVYNDNIQLQWITLSTQKAFTIWSSDHNIASVGDFSTDEVGEQLVFTLPDNQGGYNVWYYQKGTSHAILLGNKTSLGITPGLLIKKEIGFTADGRYIELSLQRSQLELIRKKNAASLEVWSYRDTVIRSNQPNSLMPRDYIAMLNPDTRYVIQLEHEFERLKTVNGDFAVIGKLGSEIYGDRLWMYKGKEEKDSNWLVSLKDGLRLPLKTSVDFNAMFFSPGGRYLVYFDPDEKCNFFSYDLISRKLTQISSAVPPWQLGDNDEYARPAKKPWHSLGVIKWIAGDKGCLVYDNYDVWLLDPSGNRPAENITNGYGRKHHIQLRLAQMGNFEKLLTDQSSLLLIAFNAKNKNSELYHKRLSEKGNPILINSYPFDFNDFTKYFRKARDTNIWIFLGQNASLARNFYSTMNLKNYKPITDLQPHKQYNWLKAELISFIQTDGTGSQGILYRPENFDPRKKYPVLIHYYKQKTDELHKYPTPMYTGSANINIPWFVSRGYLVFTPDIYFANGYNGPSALNTVEGAARYLSKLTFVDSNKIGISGHSFAGGLTNYIVTHSKMFAAVLVGAGTSNKISSALQLSGVASDPQRNSRYPQGEISNGNSIWNQKKEWVEQSSVLYADHVSSPLLIFHCKNDGSVPWAQGVEMFTALWRLEKKTWMLEYDNGGHSVDDQQDMEDFTIRSTQFFDHNLKNAPAPSWMTQGIPAYLKQVEDRLELDPSGSCGTKEKPCSICSAWNNQYKRNPLMFDKPIAEWKLDADIKEELNKKETERYNNNMKGETERIKENNEKLKGMYCP